MIKFETMESEDERGKPRYLHKARTIDQSKQTIL